jgi:protein-S-isoprenylcysteine O-methyltransferase Ste14
LIFALEAAVEATCVLASAYPSSLSSHALTFFIGSPSVHPRLFALSPSFTFAHLLAISGGLLRLWAFRALGRHFTFELAVLKDHALVTSGPYARVRHPSYTGLVGLMWGAALALGARGSWSREVLMPRLWAGSGVGAWAARVFGAGMLALQWAVIAALVGRTRAEDAFLRERFGKEWDAWASSVRWRLVPGLF